MLKHKFTALLYIVMFFLIYQMLVGGSFNFNLSILKDRAESSQELHQLQAESDIKQFISKAKVLHPNLSNYLSYEKLEIYANQLSNKICSEPCSVREFKIIILRIINLIGTDHLFLKGNTQSLPFELHKSAHNEFKLLLDTGEVIRDIKLINGMQLEEVWSELGRLTPRLNANLENSYVSAYSSRLLPLLLNRDIIEVETKGELHTFNVIEERLPPPMSITEYENYLYVKISSMSKLDNRMLFNELNKLSKQYLVLDLRGNRGGSVAKTAKLFEFLTGLKGFKYISPYENRLIKLSKELTELNRSRSPLWLLTSAFLECGFKDAYFYKEIKPKLTTVCENVEARTQVAKIQTSPQIYIIIDGHTASSAAIFAGQMKLLGKAKIFGSVAYGNSLRNYGNSKLITLNYSRLMIGIPTTYTYRDESQDIWPNGYYRGVSPHTHCLKSTCLDLINEETYKSSVDL
ncbi:S41 family peptidase [Pseudoalteromonas phenolica]|uniref:S41 family peptidase n=1 Tax=Pseudoalteromonas phenolica TaxID=161398 RepID=UPI00110C1D12|nr:S41 family peptidase [Pseudoalteromonas phenolica]TMO54348.1 hypothetical protein CWC21_15530 [Pseudoalteromonas phenolica]